MARDDDRTHRLHLTLSGDQYRRLTREYAEGLSDAERARMAIEEGIRARERYITKQDFFDALEEVVDRLDAIHDELADG